MKRLIFLIYFVNVSLVSYYCFGQTDIVTYINESKPNYVELQNAIVASTSTDANLKQEISSIYNVPTSFELTDKQVKGYQRHAWFWETRIDDDGEYGTYAKEFINALNNSGQGNQNSLTLKWDCMGPFGTPNYSNNSMGAQGNGWVGSIHILSSDHNTIYAGGRGSGLWKTTNGGQEWDCISSDVPGGVTDFVFNENSNEIFLLANISSNGLLKQSSGSYCLGIFKSSDGGDNWQMMNSGFAIEDLIQLNKIQQDAQNPDVLYAMCRHRVYKTVDKENWQLLYEDEGITFNDILVPSGYEGYLLLATVKDQNSYTKSSELLLSKNGGASFSSLTISSRFNNYSDNAIDYLESEPENIFMVYESGGYTKVERYNLNTLAWDQMFSATGGTNDWMPLIFEATTNNFYAAGVYLNHLDKLTNIKTRITDGYPGSIIPPPANYMHADIRDIDHYSVGNKDVLIIGHDGGISKLTFEAGATNIEDITGDLCVSRFYTVAISETNPNLYLCGAHDCGTSIYENGSFTTVLNCDGGSAYINSANNDVMFAVCNSTLKRSTNGGESWSSTGISTAKKLNIRTVEKPGAPQTIFVGEIEGFTGILNRSDNSGASFTPKDKTTGFIHAIEVSKKNSNYIFYSSFVNGGSKPNHYAFRKSFNGGESWSNLGTSGLSAIYTKAPITAITTSPNDINKIWISFGKFSANNKVFVSDNLGNSWSNFSTGLPNLPVQGLNYIEEIDALFALTDVGIYYRYTNSPAWLKLEGNLPLAIISELKVNHASGEIIVSTYGRGVWKTALPGNCYSGQNKVIRYSSETWAGDAALCDNLRIETYGTLKITGKLIMPHEGSITVSKYGTLIVDQGEILNAKIIVQSGGKLIIRDNGAIYINKPEGDNLVIQKGGIFEGLNGVVIIED